jgi:hypothetical protein
VPPPTDAPLRVLLTNRVLAQRTGTELYVHDVAIGLRRRGHAPVVYSPRLGEVAADIRRLTIPVVDDLAKIAEPPDIIHGHHGLETLTAALAFPRVPVVSVCHSWVGWADQPVAFPRIRRYLAVDDTCRDRLVSEHGVAPDRVEVILNAVDLERFRPRPPLPPRPARALIFSNGSRDDTAHVTAIRDACGRSGISLEIAGTQSGRVLERPEDTLGSYDLVFAKARAALEAAAVGTAVVLCDVAGAGPMLTTGNIDALRRLNFGMRALNDAPTAEGIAREIGRYDAADATEVSRRIRALAGHETQLDQLLAVYGDVLAESAGGTYDAEAEMRAAAAYLRRLSPRLHERDVLKAVLIRLMKVPLASGFVRRRARRGGAGALAPGTAAHAGRRVIERMPRLRWGLLSTARINRAVIPAIRGSARSELTAVASRTLDRAREYAAEWRIPRAIGSYEALVDDPDVDVLYIPLPNHLHVEWTVKALEAGKHVLCEKPLALSVEDVDRIAGACRRTGKAAAEAFMYRHHPLTAAAQAFAAGGRLGAINSYRGAFTFLLTREGDVRLDPAMGGGSLWDVGCYPVSYANLIAGAARWIRLAARVRIAASTWSSSA